MDDFDAYTSNKHTGNPVAFDVDKRDLYLRIEASEGRLRGAIDSLKEHIDIANTLKSAVENKDIEISELRTNAAKWEEMYFETRAKLAEVRSGVASDSYAITFQSMGQYRAAILTAIDTALTDSRNPQGILGSSQEAPK